MANSKIKLKTEGAVGIITIDSPKNLNALDSNLIESLNDALDRVDSDKNVRVLVITGSERAFIAGADIAAMSTMTPDEAAAFGAKGAELALKIENFRTPVIAALNGFTLGGGSEMALACDIRVASDKLKIGQPEVGLGITPGFSATVRLPQVVGVAKAKELIYTGKVIGAEEALAIGLVNSVVPHDELMESTMALAKQIANNSPSAVKLSKKAINSAMSASKEVALEIENSLFALSFASEEQREGMRAFLEKRSPSFKLK